MLEGFGGTGLYKKHYKAILADPPWHYKTYNEKGRSRCPDWKPFKGSPSKHYDTMSLDEICALPVEGLAHHDSVLFLWTTWPMLLNALEVIKCWGFTYKTCAFDWMKTTKDGNVAIGPGYWTRANTEPCLLATRGKPKRLDAGVRQAILEGRREHSRKPDCVHERIQRLVGGPYLELFARQTTPGWDSWGNETDKFGGMDDAAPNRDEKLPQVA